MIDSVTIVGTIAFPAICTAFGAAAVFFLRQKPPAALQRGMLGFAAGVMLAASVWSLLLPAIDYAEASGGSAVWLVPVGGFCLGALVLLVLEHFGERLLPSAPAQVSAELGMKKNAAQASEELVAKENASAKLAAEGNTMQVSTEPATEVNAARVIFAITLHNLPEGMIVGLAAALALAGNTEALVSAMALSVAIGLQNIPEGASVSLPMRQSGKGRFVSFLGGAASGVVEPIGALIAMAAAAWVTPLMPWLLAAAAGAMVCVSAEDMIPIAMKKGRVGVMSVVIGFALMMALDVGLG